MKKIKHQIQPTWNSCMSTCLAMILDVPAQEVIDEFHDDYQEDWTLPSRYLRSKDVDCEVASMYDTCEWGSVFLIVVPSLNIKAQNHAIIFDCREVGNAILLDPNEGKEGKLYYGCAPFVSGSGDSNYKPANDSEIELKGFIVELKIL